MQAARRQWDLEKAALHQVKLPLPAPSGHQDQPGSNGDSGPPGSQSPQRLRLPSPPAQQAQRSGSPAQPQPRARSEAAAAPVGSQPALTAELQPRSQAPQRADSAGQQSAAASPPPSSPRAGELISQQDQQPAILPSGSMGSPHSAAADQDAALQPRTLGQRRVSTGAESDRSGQLRQQLRQDSSSDSTGSSAAREDHLQQAQLRSHDAPRQLSADGPSGQLDAAGAEPGADRSAQQSQAPQQSSQGHPASQTPSSFKPETLPHERLSSSMAASSRQAGGLPVQPARDPQPSPSHQQHSLRAPEAPTQPQDPGQSKHAAEPASVQYTAASEQASAQKAEPSSSASASHAQPSNTPKPHPSGTSSAGSSSASRQAGLKSMQPGPAPYSLPPKDITPGTGPQLSEKRDPNFGLEAAQSADAQTRPSTSISRAVESALPQPPVDPEEADQLLSATMPPEAVPHSLRHVASEPTPEQGLGEVSHSAHVNQWLGMG